MSDLWAVSDQSRWSLQTGGAAQSLQGLETDTPALRNACFGLVLQQQIILSERAVQTCVACAPRAPRSPTRGSYVGAVLRPDFFASRKPLPAAPSNCSDRKPCSGPSAIPT